MLYVAAPAWAQDLVDVDPAESARFRLGALRFTPSIAISNVGVDNNVFNESTDPKSDTTAAVGPAADLWLRMGKGRLSARTSGQYLYFKEYSNQRAWNTANEMRLELPLARISPFVSGSLNNSRQRPGYEIDSRARALNTSITLGTELRLAGKTRLALSASRDDVSFDRDETFLGESLADALDRTTTREQLQIRYALTPLTTFVVTNEAIQDRFVVSDRRNADSIRIMPGFEMKPVALISGAVAFGFRRFNGLDSGLPDFNGLVGNANVTYDMAATQIAARVLRDITFSYQVEEPYYALTDYSLSVTQRITRNWDVVGRGGRQSLAYRRLDADESAATPDRVDRGSMLGGGFGYRLGEVVRLGVDINHYRRDSDVFGFRSFEGTRVGASVTYGLPQ